MKAVEAKGLQILECSNEVLEVMTEDDGRLEVGMRHGLLVDEGMEKVLKTYVGSLDYFLGYLVFLQMTSVFFNLKNVYKSDSTIWFQWKKGEYFTDRKSEFGCETVM